MTKSSKEIEERVTCNSASKFV